MKTMVSPLVTVAVIWYWKRVVALNRNSYLLEKAIMALGISLAILDCMSFIKANNLYLLASRNRNTYKTVLLIC